MLKIAQQRRTFPQKTLGIKRKILAPSLLGATGWLYRIQFNITHKIRFFSLCHKEKLIALYRIAASSVTVATRFSATSTVPDAVSQFQKRGLVSATPGKTAAQPVSAMLEYMAQALRKCEQYPRQGICGGMTRSIPIFEGESERRVFFLSQNQLFGKVLKIAPKNVFLPQKTLKTKGNIPSCLPGAVIRM